MSFADFPPTHPDGAAAWEIGPININESDEISVGYTIVNVSDRDSGGLSVGDDIKIGSAFVGAYLAIGGAIAAATGVGAVVGVVLAAAGGAVAILGEVLGDLFGHDPHCNGTVLADKENFSGGQIGGMVGALPFGGSRQIVLQYQNADSPSECGHPPDTILSWSIINQTVPDVFGGGIPLLPTQPPTPVVGSHPQDWAGLWGEKDFLEDSLVNVRIEAMPGRSMSKAVLPMKTHVPALLQQLGADPRRFTVSPFEAVPSPVPGAEPPTGQAAIRLLFSLPHQRVFLTERAESGSGKTLIEKNGQEVFDVPMIAPARTHDVFNLSTSTFIGKPTLTDTILGSPTLHLTPVKLDPLLAAGTITAHFPTPSVPEHSAVKPVGTALVARPVTLPFADSLALGDGVTLQLYGDYDTNHTLFRRHIRYLRTQSDGRVISDVMLSNSEPLPK